MTAQQLLDLARSLDDSDLDSLEHCIALARAGQYACDRVA